MDILKTEHGFSIIETLVAIIILGLLAVFITSFFNQMLRNPQLVLRTKAIYLAEQEINYCINRKAFNDTSYINNEFNLLILRQVITYENNFKINVSVKKNSLDNLVSLSRIIRI